MAMHHKGKKKMGKKKKPMKKKGLTAKQKKLPKALQMAIMRRMKKRGKK